jgi:AhpD family alkylhydroperoxidase
VNFYTALADGLLDKNLHDQIAIVVAEANGCEYCLSAHTALARKAGLSDQQLAAARDLNTGNDRVDAALKFAREIVVGRGHITPAQFEAVRRAGFSDGEIVEIIGHVAVNIFTNYFNNINHTEIDFPKVAAARNRAVA